MKEGIVNESSRRRQGAKWINVKEKVCDKGGGGDGTKVVTDRKEKGVTEIRKNPFPVEIQRRFTAY